MDGNSFQPLKRYEVSLYFATRKWGSCVGVKEGACPPEVGLFEGRDRPEGGCVGIGVGNGNQPLGYIRIHQKTHALYKNAPRGSVPITMRDAPARFYCSNKILFHLANN